MPKIPPIANKPVEHLLGPEITAERRECRLFATLSGLVVRPRSHKGVGGQLARSSRGSQAMDVDLSNDAGWRRSPLLKPLDGKMSDKVSLLEAICTIQRQLREADGKASVYVADNGVYSQSHTKKSIIPSAETAECGL